MFAKKLDPIREGQVYEGTVSLSGGDGPRRRWLVVAPDGRFHVHSIDDPDELHCWPLSVIEQGLVSGRLVYVGDEPHHPVLRLQRAKESRDILDAHLGLRGERLEAMFGLLEAAVAARLSYAPYAAAELLALIDRSRLSEEDAARVAERVAALTARWRAG